MKNCNTFSSYKNGKMYNSCKVCFNKKVRCEFCNKELNKSHLRSHIKKQHLYQHYNRAKAAAGAFAIATAKAATGAFAASRTTTQLRDSFHTNNNTGGDLLPTQLPTQLRDSYRTHNNNNNNDNNINDNNAEANAKAIANDDNNSGVNETNRTLIVGPSFCGKTHLVLNKLRLIRLEDPEKQICIITRSPEQYEDVELYIQG